MNKLIAIIAFAALVCGCQHANNAGQGASTTGYGATTGTGTSEVNGPTGQVEMDHPAPAYSGDPDVDSGGD